MSSIQERVKQLEQSTLRGATKSEPQVPELTKTPSRDRSSTLATLATKDTYKDLMNDMFFAENSQLLSPFAPQTDKQKYENLCSVINTTFNQTSNRITKLKSLLSMVPNIPLALNAQIQKQISLLHTALSPLAEHIQSPRFAGGSTQSSRNPSPNPAEQSLSNLISPQQTPTSSPQSSPQRMRSRSKLRAEHQPTSAEPPMAIPETILSPRMSLNRSVSCQIESEKRRHTVFTYGHENAQVIIPRVRRTKSEPMLMSWEMSASSEEAPQYSIPQFKRETSHNQTKLARLLGRQERIRVSTNITEQNPLTFALTDNRSILVGGTIEHILIWILERSTEWNEIDSFLFLYRNYITPVSLVRQIIQ
jgi:hypothetical protein